MNSLTAKRSLIAAACLVLACALISCNPQSKERSATQTVLAQKKQLAEEAASACKGQPVAQAAAYQPSAGLHPIVLLKSLTGIWLAYDETGFSAEWLAQTVPNTQLVACIEIETVLIETCPYKLKNGQSVSIERYQYKTDLTLYEAQTAKLIGQQSWAGSPPDQCSTTTQFSKDQTVKKVYGVAAGAREIAAWLQPYVQTP